MERGVHGACDADVHPPVPSLRPFHLPQGLADGRADGASVADSPALQRPLREPRTCHGSALRLEVRGPSVEERRARRAAERAED